MHFKKRSIVIQELISVIYIVAWSPTKDSGNPENILYVLQLLEMQYFEFVCPFYNHKVFFKKKKKLFHLFQEPNLGYLPL